MSGLTQEARGGHMHSLVEPRQRYKVYAQGYSTSSLLQQDDDRHVAGDYLTSLTKIIYYTILDMIDEMDAHVG